MKDLFRRHTGKILGDIFDVENHVYQMKIIILKFSAH